MLKNEINNNEEKLPLIDHLSELRKRIIIAIIFLVLFSIICFYFSEKLINIIIQPLPSKQLVFLSPYEAVLSRLKISLLFGILLASPFIIHQVWLFIKPALNKKEKKYFKVFIIFFIIFFLSGAIFAYFTLPFVLKFLFKYAGENIKPMLSINSYLSFFINISLLFGLVFELPLINVLFVKIGIIDYEFLIKNRKYAILIIFILSAIITPQDIFTLFLVAIPMVFLYELSILLAKIFR